MTEEIAKRPEQISTIQALRVLNTLDSSDLLAIAHTAVKDGRSGLVARGISFLQRLNESKFFDAFLGEVEDMMNAGQVRDDFPRTQAGASTLREFFEMIDGKPDEERFYAFCALFMSANAPNADSNEAILDLELMSILKGLTAGEMHLLSAFLKVRKYKVGDNFFGALANELGYRSKALVDRNVEALFKGGLIEEANYRNTGGSGGTEKVLLTDLAEALSVRIEKYKNFKEQSPTRSDNTQS